MTSEPSVIDDKARDHVIVMGSDAQKYLHSQISQDILGLPVGAVTWTLVLEPTGKVESLARLTRTGDESFDLDTDAGYGETLAARLRRFKIRVDADITVRPAHATEPTPEHEVARIAAGWPRMGFEIVPGETIPAVTGVVPLAVSFTKGCYPGQELVERMDSRGADAPRMLRIVEVATGAAIGDPVLADDGSEIGELTSVSPAGDLAIALVKRGHEVGHPPPNVAGSGR